jgi:chaperonin cofactor prefoldin
MNVNNSEQLNNTLVSLLYKISEVATQLERIADVFTQLEKCIHYRESGNTYIRIRRPDEN